MGKNCSRIFFCCLQLLSTIPIFFCQSALNTYVSSVSRRLIKDKIVVSCICPGPIELPKRYMTISQKKNNSFWKNYKKITYRLVDWQNPDEITSVIYFLTSNVASYCSGAIWNVDGSEH